MPQFAAAAISDGSTSIRLQGATLTVPDVQISRFLYLIRAVLRGSAAVACEVERSETSAGEQKPRRQATRSTALPSPSKLAGTGSGWRAG